METVTEFILGGSKIPADVDCSHEIKKTLTPWKKSYAQPRHHIKKQRHYFANKGPSSQGYGFSSSHVWMWELNYKETWALRNWCFWTVVLEKTLESSLNTRRSNKSILKEINPEHSLEGLMLKLNLQYFGHLISRTDSFEKTLMLGKIEGGSLKGMTEDEMVGWHHWQDGCEFVLALGVGDGQGSWCAAVHGVAKSWTWLSDWTEQQKKDPLNKNVEHHSDRPIKTCAQQPGKRMKIH